jgi:hypothetical protein
MHSDRTTKRNGARLVSLFLLTGLCVAATATPGAAQVQLPTVNLGDTNFEEMASRHRAGSSKSFQVATARGS